MKYVSPKTALERPRSQHAYSLTAGETYPRQQSIILEPITTISRDDAAQLSLIHSVKLAPLSTIQIPLQQNIPNNTVLLAVRTDLLPLQLLESRSGRSVGIRAQRVNSQEAELVRIIVRILFVAPMTVESKPVDGISVLTVRDT